MTLLLCFLNPCSTYFLGFVLVFLFLFYFCFLFFLKGSVTHGTEFNKQELFYQVYNTLATLRLLDTCEVNHVSLEFIKRLQESFADWIAFTWSEIFTVPCD